MYIICSALSRDLLLVELKSFAEPFYLIDRPGNVQSFHVDRGCKREDQILRRDYNWELLHGSLDFVTPSEYAESMRVSTPPPKNLVPEFLLLSGPDPGR